MKKLYKEIVIKEWEEIHSLEVEWPFNVYRGQSDSTWGLETLLQRIICNVKINQPLNIEHWLLYEFKRKAHLYVQDCPVVDDITSWLALMQHHGAPTRLLDFTRSFYVACFFALIDATEDSAVCMINEIALRALSFEIATKNSALHCGISSLRDDVYSLINKFANEYLSTIIHKNKANPDEPRGVLPGVLTVDPYKLFQRTSTQQGVFLMPCDIRLDLLSNIKNSIEQLQNVDTPSVQYNLTDLVTKLILPKKIRWTALSHLKMMNISYESLFPGIDGFAKSLAHTVIDT